MKPMIILGIIALIALLVALSAGCTLIAFNQGAVKVEDSDSHNAGTNARAVDLNISPR